MGNYLDFEHILIYPNYHVSIKKHNLGLGPLIQLGENFWGYWDDGPALAGAQLYYKHFPSYSDNKISLNFRYDLMFQYDKRKEALFTNVRVVYKTWVLSNYIGYGFNLKFGKGYYLEQGISFGWEHWVHSGDHTDNQYDYRSTYDQASMLVRLGIGYIFEPSEYSE